MNGEFRRILSSLFLTCAVIFSLSLIFSGAVSVRQTAKRNIGGTKYTMAAFVNSEKGVGISAGGKRYVLEKEKLKSAMKYREYLRFTPFGCVFEAAETVIELIDEKSK